MEAARTIRDSVRQVTLLRAQAAAQPAVMQALHDVKRLQAQRFSGMYADLLRGGPFAAAARFFLDELYGVGDFARRDEQFARIAGAIEKMFPASVAQTAAGLAALHALTEDLDLAVATAFLAQDDPGEVGRYTAAWRMVARSRDRERQLQAVVSLGRELAALTRMPGLRTMLRMMRGPATAAGLADLQRFLETGFDTFAGMARQRGEVEQFLATVHDRESALLALLAGPDPVAAVTELTLILGQAP